MLSLQFPSLDLEASVGGKEGGRREAGMSWNSRSTVCPGSAALMVTGSGPSPRQSRYEVREPNEGTPCAAPGRAGRTDPAPLWASEQAQAEGTRVAGTAWTRRGPEQGWALSKGGRGERCDRLWGLQLPCRGQDRAADGAQLRAHWSELETLRAGYF